ncbi:hypothetical protein HHK36_000380 [Tetracentron sinense]|uniref:YbaK/aminoacyl-tRNA synthetase-associated domain-containing protein n=1 Tax=Tetracentron sinense TaxID=13715 RepID=A0A835A0W6_TETSI|nr:hypothetical protein HHK36_000380 [Tetracentron sinense]
MEAVAELERVQIRILKRITELELSHLPQHFSAALSVSSNNGDCSENTTVSRLSSILSSNGVPDFLFKRVPLDYYDRSLEARREILDAPSIDHLCKSIVLVNTQAHASVTDCSDRNNSKYYIVVVQYTARFNAETVKNFLYSLNNGNIPKKKFNLRLAPEELSSKLTGYEHNGVTCIGMKTDIPVLPYRRIRIVSYPYPVSVILDEAITKLNPDFFWLGGGEIDLKLGIRTSQFINFVKPFIVSCSTT